MHQTLSGHFSLRTSRETGPKSGGSFSCPSSSNFDLRAGPRPEGLLLLRVPRSKDFPLTILHHEISFVMSSNELITRMKPSSARPAVKPHTGALNSMKLANKKKKGGAFFPASSSPTRLCDLKVNSSNPSEWRTAVTAKLPHLTHTRHVTGHSTGLV